MAQGWRKDYTRYSGFFLNVIDTYKSKPNVKSYLEIILSLVTTIVFSLFAIKPTVLTIVELNNEIKDKESVLEFLSQKVTNLQAASVLLQKESNRLILIEQAIPKTSNSEILINQIDKLALENSVRLTSISSSNIAVRGSLDGKSAAGDFEPLPGDINEIDIAFSVTGDYVNLFNFLKSVENLRRPIKIDSTIFNSNISTENTKIITLTVSGRTPYIGEEKVKTNEE